MNISLIKETSNLIDEFESVSGFKVIYEEIKESGKGVIGALDPRLSKFIIFIHSNFLGKIDKINASKNAGK